MSDINETLYIELTEEMIVLDTDKFYSISDLVMDETFIFIKKE